MEDLLSKNNNEMVYTKDYCVEHKKEDAFEI